MTFTRCLSFRMSAPAAGLAACLCACNLSQPTRSGEDQANPEAQGLRVQVHAAAFEGGLAASLAADSLVFLVSGPEMEARRFSFPGNASSIALADIAPGKDRLLVGQAYRQGRLLCEGSILTQVDAMQRAAIDLVLRPRFARLRAQFLLSALDAPVASGSLLLTRGGERFTGSWRLQGKVATLLADTLPEGDNYLVQLWLRDSAGKLLYSGSREAVAVKAGVESSISMDLIPVSITAQVSLSLAEPSETDLHLQAPSGRRAPSKAGELQLTEAYPIPTTADSGSNGEWLEIFNATADTLALAGCRLSRDKQDGETRSLRFDSSDVLLPGQAMTYGRAGAAKVKTYSAFSLVNTTATLWLTCQTDSLVLDTLRYDGAAHSEGAVAVREGQVLQRRPTTLGAVSSTGDWCLAQSQPKAGETAATPGKAMLGCREF